MFGSRKRFSKRPFVLALALAGALSLVAVDAYAKMGGGKSSFGSRGTRTYSAPPPTATTPGAAPMERSMVQPNRPGVPGAATTGAAAGNRGMGGLFSGFGGGLLAGFLGAGLLGMLFGNGFAGGLGGLASVFGLLLQIGLAALVVMLVMRFIQSRRQPAPAGGPPLDRLNRDQAGGNDRGSFLGGLGGLGGGAASGSAGAGYGTPSRGLAPAEPSDAIGIQPADYDAFEKVLSDVNAAYSAEDLGKLRSLVTPEMLSYLSEELAQNADRGVVNKVSDVKLEQGDLAEAWREGETDYATVAMRFSLVDETIDRASGKVVSGGGREEATEVWTFRRGHGGGWTLSAIQQAA